MAQAGDIGKTLQLTCYLGEGVATRSDVIESGGGSVTKAVVYSAKISIDDAVMIWGSSLAGQWPIVTASGADISEPTTSDSGHLGRVISAPIGPVPNIASDGGTATLSDMSQMRTAVVEFLGFKMVRRLPVSGAYEAGTRLGYDSSAAQYSAATASLSWFPYVLLDSSSAAGTHSVMIP